MMSFPARRIAAAVLLAGATLLAVAASQKLTALRMLPPSSWPYYAAFALSIVLAFLAGRMTPGTEVELHATRDLACRRVLSWIAVLAAGILLFQTARLDQRADPPASIYLWWLAGVAATILAFPRVRRTRPGQRPLLPIVLVALAVAVSAAARLPELGRSPAVFGGDEANQAMDGRSLLDGTQRVSPFGSGWYSTMRAGMVPAGGGAIVFSDPIAGPRLPYAVTGTLSVAATAAAAWLVAGPWAGAVSAALLALAPHHVHFSRLASVMILDALFAPLLLLLLLNLRRTGSPRVAALAGAVAGLALYGYSGGRAITLVFLLAAPIAAWWSPARGRGRRLLFVALLFGFLAAAGPNLHFAIEHFTDWNGRFGQVTVLSRQWWTDAIVSWGSPAKAVNRQFALGTLGLLSLDDMTSWYARYPILGPSLFVALGFAGLGWLFGRRKHFPAVLLLLLAGANVAGEVLTSGAPTPQRASSLLPMLAILGGAAFAGLLALLPDAAGKVRWRGLAGGVFVVAYLSEMAGRRPWGADASPDFGGAHTAFAQAVSELLRTPAWRSRPAYVYGVPYLSTDLPTFQYLLGARRAADVDPAGLNPRDLPPGLHFFAPEFEALGRRVREESSKRGFALAHPADPSRSIGYVVGVPSDPSVTNR
jgi:hypothetical protein